MLKTSPVPVREIMPEAERRQQALGASGAAVETTPKRTRRSFSAAEKLRIVKKADACIASGERGALEAMLREEGLYSSALSSWRGQLSAQGAAGLAPRKVGRKPKLDAKDRLNAQLLKRTAVLERKLHIAEAAHCTPKKSARDPGHRTAGARRRDLMDLVEDLADPIVPIGMACLAVGVSRATLYRGTRPAPPRCLLTRPPSRRRVSDVERAAILAAVHSAEFVDQSVMEVYATLLSRGVYLASIRTIYRVLAARGETKERRNQRRPHVYTKPSLTATAPNQVWTWDITKLATTAVGVFLHAYVIIDLFSGTSSAGWWQRKRASTSPRSSSPRRSLVTASSRA